MELNLSRWIAAELTQKANESRPQVSLDGYIVGGDRLNHIEGKSGAGASGNLTGSQIGSAFTNLGD